MTKRKVIISRGVKAASSSLEEMKVVPQTIVIKSAMPCPSSRPGAKSGCVIECLPPAGPAVFSKR